MSLRGDDRSHGDGAQEDTYRSAPTVEEEREPPPPAVVPSTEERSEPLPLAVVPATEERPKAPPPAVVPAAEERPEAVPQKDEDLDGARLVALNMALSGESREQTDRYLADSFQLSDRATLLDEVYAAVEG